MTPFSCQVKPKMLALPQKAIFNTANERFMLSAFVFCGLFTCMQTNAQHTSTVGQIHGMKTIKTAYDTQDPIFWQPQHLKRFMLQASIFVNCDTGVMNKT